MAVGLQLVVLATVLMGGVTAASRERVVFMEMQVEEIVKETEDEMTATSVNQENLPGLVKSLKELSTLYKAVVLAELAGALSAKGPFTLFAPTDEAFKKAGALVPKLLSNKTALTEVLTYHVLNGAVLSKDIKDELTVQTLNGKDIRFNIYPNNKVYTAQCAPINLKAVDKMASNGVLHELEAVMLPPYGNIAQTAIHLGKFGTLVKALTVAGLVDTLSNKGPFTVFAPTDAAFAKLGKETLDNLLKNKTALTDVLLYHVANLTYCAAGLVSYKQIEMLNTKTVQISEDGDMLKVNNIPVLPAGVEGGVTNGVIHVIEDVLIPPSMDQHLHP